MDGAVTPPEQPDGRNERQQGVPVPVRRTGVWIVYDTGSRRGQWRVVYPISASEDSFTALETVDLGNRTTKYVYESCVGMSEEEPLQLKLHESPAREELLEHRARLASKVLEIVSKGVNMVAAELAPARDDQTVAAPLQIELDDASLALVKNMLRRLDSAEPSVQMAASTEIFEAVKWMENAPPGQRSEANRPYREAIGAFGGVSKLCELIEAADTQDGGVLIQHWETVGQLCLCPSNSKTAAAKGVLGAANAILANDNSAPRLRKAVAWALSIFAGFCSTDCLRQLLAAGLLPLLVAAMTEANEQRESSNIVQDSELYLCVSTLTALARNGALREQLLEEGLAEAFGYLAFTESMKMGSAAEKPSAAYIQAAFGLASLVGQEENHPAISKDIDRTISWMVDGLRAALDSRPWPEARPPTLWVVTHGVASMAIADCNKDKLGAAGAIPLLIRVLNDIGDATTDAAWSRENATAALWALSFSAANKKQLEEYSGVLMPLIQQINEKASMYTSAIGGDWRKESICRTARSAANLKFKMESREMAVSDTQRRIPFSGLRGLEGRGAPPLGTGQQILVSHHPVDGDRVRQLKTLLGGNGYSAIVYNNQDETIAGKDQVEKMMELATEADGIVVCMSEHYKISRICRTEYEYCHYDLGKPVVIVNLEPGYIPDGWLDQLVGSQLWYNCESDSEMQKNEDGILWELAAKVSTSVTMLTPDQEAATQRMLSRLHSEDTGEQLAASKEIHDAVAWAADAPIGQRVEANRPHREAVGTLGGVERVCALTKTDSGVKARCQHWATLGQLCLCPKNAATSAAAGALVAAKAILSDSTSPPELRTEVALCLSRFADYCSDRESKAVVAAGLLPLLVQAMMKPATGVHTNRDERDWCISVLTALARNLGVRTELQQAGVAEAFSLMLMAERRKLGPHPDKPSEAYLKGSYGLACLVGQEENHPAISKDIERIIPWMVEDLRAALDRRPWPTMRRTLWVVLHGISIVACADCNKDRLGEAGMIPLLIRVLLEAKAESTEGAWAEENATSALWALAFTEANKARMLEQEAELHGALLRICERSGEHSEESTFAVIAAARRAKMDAAYLLWMLGLAESDDESDSESDDHQTHVLISYADEQAVLATALYDRLRQSGYRTWAEVDSATKSSSNDSGGELPRTSSSTRCGSELHVPGERAKILDDMEMRKSVFISHSRRDPGAMNMTYCMVYALRYALDDKGNPLCPVTYLPNTDEEMWLWVDKEQMADAGGDDWVQILTKAQKHCCANWFFIGNAFCGSSECMKEFLYADQKRFNLVPIFLESFCDSEEQYGARKGYWRCDHDLSSFDTWESKKDMIDRLACSRQGVPALLDTNDFMCDLCRESRDMVCSQCTNWERACATASGARLRESVETLARYLSRENQLAGRGDAAVATMTARVAKASCVIVLCSRAYKLSPSCRTESLHASSVNKPVICVSCEDWEIDGWLKNFVAKAKSAISYRNESQIDEVFVALQDALEPHTETLRRTKSALSRSRSMSTDRSDALSRTTSRRSTRIFLDSDNALEGGDEPRHHASKLQRTRSATTAAVRFSHPHTNHSSSKDDSGSQSSGSALATDDTAKANAEPFAPKEVFKKGQRAGASGGAANPAHIAAELSRSISRASTRSAVSALHNSDAARKTGVLTVPSSPALGPLTPGSPAISAFTSARAPPLSSPQQSDLAAFALGDEEDTGGPNLSGISRTESAVSVHEHIQLLHKSVNAQKDAELADLRAQHKAAQDRQAHELALIQTEQRLAEVHRLEKEAIVRAAELREMRVIAMAACAVAVVIAVACRKSF